MKKRLLCSFMIAIFIISNVRIQSQKAKAAGLTAVAIGGQAFLEWLGVVATGAAASSYIVAPVSENNIALPFDKTLSGARSTFNFLSNVWNVGKNEALNYIDNAFGTLTESQQQALLTLYGANLMDMALDKYTADRLGIDTLMKSINETYTSISDFSIGGLADYGVGYLNSVNALDIQNYMEFLSSNSVFYPPGGTLVERIASQLNGYINNSLSNVAYVTIVVTKDFNPNRTKPYSSYCLVTTSPVKFGNYIDEDIGPGSIYLRAYSDGISFLAVYNRHTDTLPISLPSSNTLYVNYNDLPKEFNLGNSYNAVYGMEIVDVQCFTITANASNLIDNSVFTIVNPGASDLPEVGVYVPPMPWDFENQQLFPADSLPRFWDWLNGLVNVDNLAHILGDEWKDNVIDENPTFPDEEIIDNPDVIARLGALEQENTLINMTLKEIGATVGSFQWQLSETNREMGVLEGLLNGVISDTDARIGALEGEIESLNETTFTLTGWLDTFWDKLRALLKDLVNWLSLAIIGDGTINLDSLRVNAEILINKFPFCIPFDLAAAIRLLSQTPLAPVFVVDFQNTALQSAGTFVIDFAEYNNLAQIIRFFMFLFTMVSLIVLTRRLIKG